jgi:hypothetical protein
VTAGVSFSLVCSEFRSALPSMEAEDRPGEPGSKNEDQPTAGQPGIPLGGLSPGPTALWDMLETKFLEYQQLTHQNPDEHRKSLLSLLPLFLKVRIFFESFNCFNNYIFKVCSLCHIRIEWVMIKSGFSRSSLQPFIISSMYLDIHFAMLLTIVTPLLLFLVYCSYFWNCTSPRCFGTLQDDWKLQW